MHPEPSAEELVRLRLLRRDTKEILPPGAVRETLLDRQLHGGTGDGMALVLEGGADGQGPEAEQQRGLDRREGIIRVEQRLLDPVCQRRHQGLGNGGVVGVFARSEVDGRPEEQRRVFEYLIRRLIAVGNPSQSRRVVVTEPEGTSSQKSRPIQGLIIQRQKARRSCFEKGFATATAPKANRKLTAKSSHRASDRSGSSPREPGSRCWTPLPLAVTSYSDSS